MSLLYRLFIIMFAYIVMFCIFVYKTEKKKRSYILSVPGKNKLIKLADHMKHSINHVERENTEV